MQKSWLHQILHIHERQSYGKLCVTSEIANYQLEHEGYYKQ